MGDGPERVRLHGACVCGVVQTDPRAGLWFRLWRVVCVEEAAPGPGLADVAGLVLHLFGPLGHMAGKVVASAPGVGAKLRDEGEIRWSCDACKESIDRLNTWTFSKALVLSLLIALMAVWGIVAYADDPADSIWQYAWAILPGTIVMPLLAIGIFDLGRQRLARGLVRSYGAFIRIEPLVDVVSPVFRDRDGAVRGVRRGTNEEVQLSAPRLSAPAREAASPPSEDPGEDRSGQDVEDVREDASPADRSTPNSDPAMTQRQGLDFVADDHVAPPAHGTMDVFGRPKGKGAMYWMAIAILFFLAAAPIVWPIVAYLLAR